MSSSHARKRAAAIFAAVPVLLAGGPLATPAFAAGEYSVENLVQNGQVLGPNAGFLGLGIGQSGTTAIFKITPPTNGATLARVKLALTADSTSQFNFANELATGDGLAVYADVDGIANGFSAKDKADGQRSTGFETHRPDASGNVPVEINLGSGTSGAPAYYVTIRPNTNARNLPVRFQVAGGDVGGNGGDGPSTTVATPSGENRMVIDALKPNGGTAPARTSFTVEQKHPGLEDAYNVLPGIASEPGVRVAFFNASADTGTSALLRRPGYNPELAAEQQVAKVAIDTVINPEAPTAAHRITIGDGTGIVPKITTVARNNQLSNAVYARLVDGVGNMSLAATLSHCAPATSGCATTPNGNIVISPEKPTSTTFENSSGAVDAINLNNEAVAPVRVTSPSSAGADRSSTAASWDGSSKATIARAQIVQLGSSGAPDFSKVAESTTAWATAADVTVDTRTKIGEGSVAAIGYNIDAQGNVSEAVATVKSIPKDITRPTVSMDLASGAASGTPGDLVHVRFSEPMDTSAIQSTSQLPGSPSNNPRCVAETDPPGDTVSNALIPKDEGLGGADRTWGYNNCFVWAPDGTYATIRLGDDSPTCDAANTCPDRAGAGDKVYFAGTYASPVVADANGNQAMGMTPPLSSVATSGFTTIIAPASTPTLAETRDLRNAVGALTPDGVLDAIDVTFTLDVDVASINANKSNVSIVGNGTTVPLTSAEYASGTSQKVVRFNFGGSFGTGVRPFVQLAETAPEFDTGVRGAGTDKREVQPFSIQAADKAAPRPKTAVTHDADGDGYIDQVVLTYSEPIVHEDDHNDTPGVDEANPLDTGGYRVDPYNVWTSSNTGSPGRNPVTPHTGTDDKKIIKLKEKVAPAAHDTSALPTLIFKATNPTTGIKKAATDAADNVGGDFTMTVSDGTPLRIVSRITRDRDSDGRIDAIDLKLSEIVPAASVGASFAVTDRSIADQRALGADGISLWLTESNTPGVGDTGTKPTVRYIGGLEDSAGNASPGEATPVASTDGAGPAIMGACPSTPKGSNGLCPEDDPANDAAGNPDKGAKLAVFYSEVVDAASVVAADLKVEQPVGTDKGTATGITTAATADNKYSVSTLTFAANTLDHLADLYVRFSAANVVTDTATPTKIGNSQVSPVLGAAFPAVGLTLTCPVASNAATCSELTVNMDATGNSGVSLWRLAQTARATVPPAEEFTTTPPGSTYTFPAEGRYTLYLSGKDGYNRLSSEIAREMYILKAPQISGLQFATTTAVPRSSTKWSATTLLDGDTVKIGANASGTDAAEWAANSAPTGGGCLPQHMSVDVRSITGRSTTGAVAPSTCNLLSGTEKPTRQMLFPNFTAAGTTKYPVGTALKISDSDPGFLVVDGPNGTVARRNFISVNARRSWMISDASVIKVSTGMRDALPRLSKNIGYRDGAVVKGSSTGYYYVENGVKRPVSTYRLQAWRISTARAYSLTTTELRAMPTGTTIGGTAHAPGTWIKYSDGRIYQIVKNAQGKVVRRKAASVTAVRTLVPTGTRSQVYAANSSDSKLPFDSWLRGYRDGTVLRKYAADGRTLEWYGVIARGSLRKFADPRTFNTLGYNGANALTVSLTAMPRVSGQTYRTGESIGRYSLAEVNIKVTNKAGASVTAEVPNDLGLFGLGSLDPAPAGWDPTR